jgi:hypothetical protein
MLEPIFIPKLQIYFAEFPYLDYFIYICYKTETPDAV